MVEQNKNNPEQLPWGPYTDWKTDYVRLLKSHLDAPIMKRPDFLKDLWLSEDQEHQLSTFIEERLEDEHISDNEYEEIVIEIKKLKNWLIEETQNEIWKLKTELEPESKMESSRKIENDSDILQKATDFIIKHEGFAPISKWDGWQYSWGYWTKAPWKGLKINRQRAKEELNTHVLKVEKFVTENFPNMNDNQKISLISFFYNNWISEKWKENLLYRLKNMWKHIEELWWIIKPISVANMILKYTYSWWEELEWLENRRNAEAKLFLQQT